MANSRWPEEFIPPPSYLVHVKGGRNATFLALWNAWPIGGSTGNGDTITRMGEADGEIPVQCGSPVAPMGSISPTVHHRVKMHPRNRGAPGVPFGGPEMLACCVLHCMEVFDPLAPNMERNARKRGGGGPRHTHVGSGPPILVSSTSTAHGRIHRQQF